MPNVGSSDFAPRNCGDWRKTWPLMSCHRHKCNADISKTSTNNKTSIPYTSLYPLETMKHHKVMLPVLASHLFQVKQHPLDGVYSTCSRLCCHTSPPCAQHSFAEDALSYTNQGPAGPAPQKRNRHHVTIIHPP